MNKVNLKNGINLIIEPMPNTHSITIGVYIKAGARYEGACNNGITHLLEHIHFRELDCMSQEQLYYRMESIGSTLRAATYYDFMKFSMKIRPCFLQKCVDIFKVILSTYTWTEESFRKEKEIVIKQIEESDFEFSESAIVRQCLLQGSNLANSIMGSKDSLDTIDLSQVVAYKKEIFNKNNLIICVTGCIAHEEIQYINNQFSFLSIPDGSKKHPDKFEPLLYNRKPNIVLKNDEWDFLYVNVSFDVDYCNGSIEDLKILNCILGEGVGSWLQKSVRERLQYTSNIFSEPELYEDFAFLHIKFSVQKKYFYQCIKEVFSIIARLKYDITFSDLEVSLPFYTEDQMFLRDDTEQMNFDIAYNSFVLGREMQNFTLKKDDITIAHLMNFAKAVLVPKNTSVVVFGNCTGISKKSIREVISSLEK